MSGAKAAITMDEKLLRRLDRLVMQREFESRSKAIEEALRELDRLDCNRLVRECARLLPADEQKFAEAWLTTDLAD